MKMFEMMRKADESGVSGTGTVLQGVVFDDGTTVIRWKVEGKPNSTGIYNSFSCFRLIHIDSHPTNETEIVWYEGIYSAPIPKPRWSLESLLAVNAGGRLTITLPGREAPSELLCEERETEVVKGTPIAIWSRFVELHGPVGNSVELTADRKGHTSWKVVPGSDKC